MVAMFSVSKGLSMSYNSDFSLLQDESSCDEGEGIHAYLGPRVIAPVEVAAPNRAVISEPIASGNIVVTL